MCAFPFFWDTQLFKVSETPGDEEAFRKDDGSN